MGGRCSSLFYEFCSHKFPFFYMKDTLIFLSERGDGFCQILNVPITQFHQFMVEYFWGGEGLSQTFFAGKGGMCEPLLLYV